MYRRVRREKLIAIFEWLAANIADFEFVLMQYRQGSDLCIRTLTFEVARENV